MVSEDTLEAISEFLVENSGIYATELPDEIHSDDALYSEVHSQENCPQCGEEIIDESPVEEGKVICAGPCTFPPAPETDQYKLNVQTLLVDFADALGYSVAKPDVADDPLPLYTSVDVNEFLRLNLICNPALLEESVEKLFSDAVRNSRVNVLLVPEAVQEEVHELSNDYPVANYTPPFGLPMLADPKPLSQIIQSAVAERKRSAHAIQESHFENKDLAELLENNPSAIRTELAFCRIRREASINGSTLGDYFEDVCEAALMSLNISTDSLGDSGENVADLSFIFPSTTDVNSGEEILGIVDTKSSTEANLSTEGIANKHRDYIHQSTATRFQQDKAHVAHVFVVFDMAGLSANELAWYKLIEEEYANAPIDATMVVLYADALSHMVHLAQSPIQKNELNRSTHEPREVFRPFFNFRRFRKLDQDIRTITRVDTDGVTGRKDGDEDEYREEYKQCERLIVVLPEMVDKYARQVMDWEGDDTRAFQNYPNHDY